jgi:hypothetical protein
MSRLPTGAETLLLRAALGDGPGALADWNAWRARVAFADLRGDAVGLVPLLYRNLRRLGVPAAELGRYAGVYRHTWAANRLALQTTGEVLALLERAGVETVVLKGAALALGVYHDAGARPMNDVDVLVPRARLPLAMTVLAAAGFTTNGVERAVARDHSLPFVDARQRNIDLHWCVAGDATHDGADDELWRAAQPFTVGAATTRTLAPADLLYHIVVHAHASETAHLRWAADATKVLQAGPIDWPRLVALAHRRRMVLPVRAALDYLARALDAPVPPEVRAELAAAPVGWIDRVEYRHQLAIGHYPVAKVLVRLWCGHRRASAARGPALVQSFPAYLRRYYETGDTWRLAARAVGRGLRRMRRDGLL